MRRVWLIVILLLGSNFIPLTYSLNSNEKEVTEKEIIIEKHHFNGEIERRIVKLNQNEMNEIVMHLIDASSFKDRLSILKEYNLISDSEIEQFKKEVEEVKKFFKKIDYSAIKLEEPNNDNIVFNILSMFAAFNINLGLLPALILNFPIGISLFTGIINWFLPSILNISIFIPSLDMVDISMRLGYGFGGINSEGLLGVQDMFLGPGSWRNQIPSFNVFSIFGFVGFAVFFPHPFGKLIPFGLLIPCFVMYIGFALAVFGLGFYIE